MNSYVLVICSYDPKIKSYLDYDGSWYKDTKEGVTVTRHLFSCDTTSQSRELANFFLEIDEWDFNQHDVTSRLVKIANMTKEEFEENFKRGDYYYLFMPYRQDLVALAPYIKLALFMPEG